MSPNTRHPFTLELALLGFLHQAPLHGYQIHQQLNDPQGLGSIWRLKQSHLYALLGKLEEAGYIHASLQPQANRPARRVFHLTESGRQAYLDWLSQPVQAPRQVRQEFMAKLYFAHLEGEPTCSRLLARQREFCQDWLARQHNQETQENQILSFATLLQSFRIQQIQGILSWLAECQTTSSHNPKSKSNNSENP